MTTGTLPGRFPSLDGWRAVSILMVMGSHAELMPDAPKWPGTWLYWICDGNLGVRFFFVISGFLITYLLLREHAQMGTLSLRGFYIRRALRILPVYFAFLAVSAALQMLTPAWQPRLYWIGNLTFSTNLVFARVLNSATQAPMVHLWTLAVEEQFYFLWPVALCLVGLNNTRRILLLLFVPVALTPLCKAVAYIRVLPPAMDMVFQYYATIFYVDSFAIGCLAAVVFVRYHSVLCRLLFRFRATVIIGVIVLVVMPHILGKLYLAGGMVEQAGSSFHAFAIMITRNTLQAAGFALLLVQSVSSPRLFRPLNWAWMRRVGVLSYSLYIWHPLLFADPRVFGLPSVWFMSFYWCWAPAFLLAAFSYYCLEKPLFSLRSRFRERSLSSAVALQPRLPKLAAIDPTK